MKSSFFFFEISVPTFPRLVESLLGPNWYQRVEKKNLKEAKKFARIARFFSLSFPNIRPHTFRSLGRLNLALGRKKKAKKCFERAVHHAKQIGACYDHARALIDMGHAFEEHLQLKDAGLRRMQELGAVMPQIEFESVFGSNKTAAQ